jgi:hypothetical protein
MPTIITVNVQQLEALDLAPVSEVLDQWIATQTLFDREQSIQFQIDYPQDSEQAQELPDIPEVRLWFLRVDSIYPWLPYWLDWKSGELFLMQKIFVLHHWLKQQGITRPNKLKQMAELFGYELEDSLFALLDKRYTSS